MKKKLFAIALTVLLPIALLGGSGDVNGDFKINVADIVELVNYLNGNQSENFSARRADANNDGYVDENDIPAIAELINSGAEVVSADYELVIEKTDDTSYIIPITHNCPILGLAFFSDHNYLEVNMPEGLADDDRTYVLCSEIKRIYTRDYQGKIALPPAYVQAETSTPESYRGQHVSFKLTSGERILYDLEYLYSGFLPVVRDDKIVWLFMESTLQDDSGDFLMKEFFSINDVECIDFRSAEYDKTTTRKALTEFYKTMNGDAWPHKENWCSDKPICQWHGVNVSCMGTLRDTPWVNWFDLTDFFFGQLDYSSGSLPECFFEMGPVSVLRMPSFMLSGSIPEFLGNMYSLFELAFYGNKLSGVIPVSISKLPHLHLFDVQFNQYEGQLPEDVIKNFMEKGANINFNNNFFSGKIPEGILKHPRFAEYWPSFMIQRGDGLDLSDLTIPAPVFSTTDMNGNAVDLNEVYKKNKYTLLYRWDLVNDYQEPYTKNLVAAFDALKEKGFEVIGLHGGWADLDKEKELLSNYMNEQNIHWRNILYNDWMPLCNLFSWTGLTMLLVDQNGNVVFNDFMDEEAHLPLTYDRSQRLFSFLEEKLGKIDYNFYTSTDLSHDGEVMTLQTASVGQGVDLVFVGEGFTDKDLEDAEEFGRIMQKTMNQFFSYEPYRSLQSRFNVYAVKTVSPNAEFYGNATHAIDEDISKAFEYASKVPDLIEGRPMFVNVIYKEDTGGRSYCKMLEDDSYVAFLMDGVSNVLNHEAGGHGIGKLFDEYVEYTGLTLPEEEKTELENYWTTAGWGANVDWHSDPTEVKWSAFVSDNSYADENIGAYEGSYLYQFGAYRPTENSMMRYNDTPFNAPSREAIYKRVMKLSEGDSWTYDRDEFVTFDTSGHTQFLEAQTSASRAMARGSVGNDRSNTQKRITTRPPVILKGTWRDAAKCEKVEYTSKPVATSFR